MSHILIAAIIGIAIVINSLIIFYATCKFFLRKEDEIREKNIISRKK